MSMNALGRAVPASQQWVQHLKRVVPSAICSNLVRQAEAHGFRQFDGSRRTDTALRSNLRVEWCSEGLGQQLYHLIAPCLPRVVLFSGKMWKPVALNSLIHVSKYTDDEQHHFDSHRDTRVHGDDATNLATFQLYLNDDYLGGVTSLKNRAPPFDWDDVQPIATGDVLLFDHALIHRVNSVELGTKYTLRSDVLFEPVDACSTDAKDFMAFVEASRLSNATPRTRSCIPQIRCS